MKKITTKKIKIGEKTLPVTIHSINKEDKINFSRVYIIASNNNGKIALIYNSKRNIWGFPGGHPEKNETVYETAQRECIEEIKYSIKNCEPKYVLSNKLDDETEEMQIICFAKINKKSNKFVDENESVNQIKFTKVENVLNEIGNADLWKEILQEYNQWIDNI